MRYILFILILLFLPAVAQVQPSKPDTAQLFYQLNAIAEDKSSLIDSLGAIQKRRETAKALRLVKHTYKTYYRGKVMPDGRTQWWVFHYKIEKGDTLFQKVTKYTTHR